MAEYKNEQGPYLIVTCGNTGSGKTGLMIETLRFLGIQNEPYVKILIDDIVENNAEYKREIKKIIHKVSILCREERRECLDEDCFYCNESWYYNNPTESLYKDFKDAYFGVRTKKNCNGINPEWTCDELNNHYLKTAINQRKNIVFEFTGQYIPDWLFSKKYLGDDNREKHSPYSIVVSCSVVNFENLSERNKSRASKAVAQFKQDNNQPAPRLPNVSPHYLQGTMTQYKKILKQLYKVCMLNQREEEEEKLNCGDAPINRLLVYDNNGRSLKLIFDSNISNQSDFEKIEDSFGSNMSPRRVSRKRVVKSPKKRVVKSPKKRVVKSPKKRVIKSPKKRVVKSPKKRVVKSSRPIRKC